MKSRVAVRKPVYRKRYVKKSFPVDSTVQRLNGGRDRPICVSKSLPFNVNGTVSTSGTTGFVYNFTSSSFSVGTLTTFDPTGNFGNNSGNITSGAPTLIAAQITDWTSFAALYSQYKVKKIHLKFTAYDSTSGSTLGSQPPTMFIRYNNEYAAPSPTTAIIADERNWMRKTFTPEHPDFSYSFYPKVMCLDDNRGLISTDSRVPKSMRWTSTATPVELWGVKAWIAAIGTSSAGTYIAMDVTYDICFRGSK